MKAESHYFVGFNIAYIVLIGECLVFAIRVFIGRILKSFGKIQFPGLFCQQCIEVNLFEKNMIFRL
jgi:hypothetical protein